MLHQCSHSMWLTCRCECYTICLTVCFKTELNGFIFSVQGGKHLVLVAANKPLVLWWLPWQTGGERFDGQISGLTCGGGEIGCGCCPLAQSEGGANLCKQPYAISIWFFSAAMHEIKAIYNLDDNYIILIPSWLDSCFLWYNVTVLIKNVSQAERLANWAVCSFALICKGLSPRFSCCHYHALLKPTDLLDWDYRN